MEEKITEVGAVPFHFLLLGAGEALKKTPEISAIRLQNFMADDNTFKVRPNLSECRLALKLLEASGFLRRVSANPPMSADNFQHSTVTYARA